MERISPYDLGAIKKLRDSNSTKELKAEIDRLTKINEELVNRLDFMVGLSKTWGNEWFSRTTWSKIQETQSILETHKRSVTPKSEIE